MEETRNEFGERVIRVENADEFLAAISGAEEKGEFAIDAPLDSRKASASPTSHRKTRRGSDPSPVRRR